MDISKILKTVNNLNDYIVATQEVTNKPSNSKIQFNMSTVLSLKKIRSLEIEVSNFSLLKFCFIYEKLTYTIFIVLQ